MNAGVRTVGILTLAMLAAVGIAQSATPGTPAVDPAITAKAGAGDAPSMLLVARAYAAGSGVDPDDTIAAGWLSQGCRSGKSDAQIQLAECYRDGKGVSVTWLRPPPGIAKPPSRAIHRLKPLWDRSTPWVRAWAATI